MGDGITKQGLYNAVSAGIRAFVGAYPGHVDLVVTSSLAKRIVGEVEVYIRNQSMTELIRLVRALIPAETHKDGLSGSAKDHYYAYRHAIADVLEILGDKEQV